MKNLILLLGFLAIAPLTFAQDECIKACKARIHNDFYFVTTYPKDKCVTIKGEMGEQIVNALYAQANKKRRNNNFHANIRNFEIPEVADQIRITIIEGVHSYYPEESKSTFHIYKNEKEKSHISRSLGENQRIGYSIHFRHPSFEKGSNDEVTKKISAYLMQLIP